ncbi:MAG: hypothetical protein V4596_05955 [Bdellovibrionota bacterium]
MELDLNHKKNGLYLFEQTLPIFMRFCEELALITTAYNIKMVPYNSVGINKFISLDLSQQFEILNSLKSYLQQLTEASLKKIEMRSDGRLHAWSSLTGLGFVPSKDLFDKISPTDIIEIYDVSSLQLFRSFELYNHISYSFSELFCFPWMELFERDSFVGQRMLNASNEVLSGKGNDVYLTNMPNHIVKEKFSVSKHWIEMKHRLMAPLNRADGSRAGFINVFEIVNYGSEKSST